MTRQHMPRAHNEQMYASLRNVLTVTEAAERFLYSPRTIRQWCIEGRIAARKDSLGRWWISAASLVVFLHSSERGNYPASN